MSNKKVRHIDISEIQSVPDLIRIAEEVERTGQPCILNRDNEEFVQITPLKVSGKKLKKGQPTSKDDPLWRIIGIAADPTDKVTDVSLNTDKYLAEAYEDKHL